MTRPTGLRRFLSRSVLIAWFAIFTLVSAGMLARHVLAMPAPRPTAALGHRLATLSPGAPSLLAVHVLSGDCTCSLRIARHLVEAPRPARWREVVLWVGDRPPPPALAQRFDVRRTSVAELAALGIEATPLLLAVTPDDRVAFSGGYTDRKQGTAIRDLEVLADIEAGAHVPTIALFGCAASDRLRAALSHLPVP